NFSTLISQVSPLSPPAVAIPTYETQTIYYNYVLSQFVVSEIIPTPIQIPVFDGMGTVGVVAKWNGQPPDAKEIPIEISFFNDQENILLGADYEYNETLQIYVKKDITIPSAYFQIEFSAIPPGPNSPTTDLIICDLYISRT